MLRFALRVSPGLIRVSLGLILPLCVGSAASAFAADHWVGTWAASPMGFPNTDGTLAEQVTLREIVHVSLGGSTVRVVLTNEFGTEALLVDRAAVAPSLGASGAIDLAAQRSVTFGGQRRVIIPVGALAVSDPVAMKLPALSDLAVTLLFPAQLQHQITAHGFADQTNFEAAGDQVATAKIDATHTFSAWKFLKNVDVLAPAEAGAIIAFGDSITDGALSTPDANARWPDVLARRLAAEGRTAGLGMLNQGVGGNRLLHDNTGPSALARLDRDVLAQPGARYLIVLEGTNDIGHSADPKHRYDAVTAPHLLFALGQIVDRAHTHGLKVIGATLTPYMGAGYSSPDGEKLRQAENEFIRHSGRFDGVIDFDRITQDPTRPGTLLPAYDSGDHLHPRDAGYKAMGEAIDLKLFEP